MSYVVLALLLTYIGWFVYTHARPPCDHCKRRASFRKMHPNHNDYGWSDSSGLCQPCAVAEELTR